MRWTKGQSGNPNGRQAENGRVRDIARQHTDEAIATLLSVAKSGKSESARVAAAVALLDRGYGKPSQYVVSENVGGPVHELTNEELMRIAAQGVPEHEREH